MTADPRPLVLIDTSAWIEVLRNRSTGALRDAVELALQENRAALAAPVWLELYRGVRGKKELEQLQSLKRLCHWLEFDAACWDAASESARRCRERGWNIPLGDVLVAACAARHGADILDNDKHFRQIARAVAR